MPRSLTLLPLLSILLLLCACSSKPVVTDTTPVHLVGGKAMASLVDPEGDGAFERLIAQLKQEEVIYIGERHDNYADHQIQLALISALHQGQRKLAIGVEWFQRPFQQHLDDYIAGRIDEAEMLRRTQYFARWGIDYRHYRPIIRYARDNGIALIALNAPSELIHAIMQGGLKSLEDFYVGQLPDEYFFTNRSYKLRLREIYKQHKGFNGPFSNFYETQLTWDETMSEQASRFLESNEDSALVVLAGNGHLEYGDGIPERVERRTEIAGKILLPFQPDMDDPHVADYLLSASAADLPPAGLLGAVIRHGLQQPEVSEVDRDGPAQRSGLRQGDRITGIDDQPIRDLTDFKLALMDKPPGSRVVLDLLRGKEDRPQRLVLTLGDPGPKNGG